MYVVYVCQYTYRQLVYCHTPTTSLFFQYETHTVFLMHYWLYWAAGEVMSHIRVLLN